MITGNVNAGNPVHILHLLRFPFRVNSLRSYAVLAVASTVLSLSAAILLARAGAVWTASMADPDHPFVSYTAILPGHVSAGLDQHNCRRAFDRKATPPCSIVPDDGPFHLISVTTRRDIIAEVSFYSQTLQLGDLIHQWGEPDSMHRSANGRAITVVWNAASNQFSATMALRGTQPHVRVVTARMNCDDSNVGACSQPS